ncbi:hypothetical protein DMN91_003377 [Ooceraea biroi]|uniref:Uncharacterized protein n=1 Tax=Ooceraea biroi TaxID=2015173 RepID=A0A3L8DXT8_OOCBI|nr:hypothetical protein DMN91_003377 [Ooceraea biroi]
MHVEARRMFNFLAIKLDVPYHRGTTVAAVQMVLLRGGFPLSQTRVDFIDSETGCTRARRHAMLPSEDDGGGSKREKEEEKGRIILVNALTALTSATSRCTRPTRDQIPSKLRERIGASRRAQLCAPYDAARRCIADAIGIHLCGEILQQYYGDTCRLSLTTDRKYFPITKLHELSIAIHHTLHVGLITSLDDA